MGMYTELILKCIIKSDTPREVNQILDFLFNRDCKQDVENLAIPTHPFFNCGRWRFIGSCSSYYHIPWASSRYSEDYLFTRSDLKNYDDEIAKFIDWLTPYIDAAPGQCIGWSWYEEESQPTLLLMPEVESAKSLHT